MALYNKGINLEIRVQGQGQGVEIPEPDGDSPRLYATAWKLVTVPTLTSLKPLNLSMRRPSACAAAATQEVTPQPRIRLHTRKRRSTHRIWLSYEECSRAWESTEWALWKSERFTFSQPWLHHLVRSPSLTTFVHVWSTEVLEITIFWAPVRARNIFSILLYFVWTLVNLTCFS